MRMPERVSGVLAGVVALSAAVPAQVAAAPVVQAQASGKVVRVDAAAGKIAIQHGAISKLELPAMTLVYRADPGLLKGISAGDQVAFTAERADGQYRIVAIQRR